MRGKDLADPSLRFESRKPTNLPTEIEKLLPEGAEWVESERLDRRITGDLYTGSFSYDKRSGRVVFDCVNPHRKDGPPPAVVTG